MYRCFVRPSCIVVVLLCQAVVSPVVASASEAETPNYIQAAWEAVNSGNNLEAARNFASAAPLGDDPASDYYNAACCFALAGEVAEGLAMIGNALDAGYANRSNVAFDRDLNNLRDDPGFAPLLARTPSIELTTNIKSKAAEAEFVLTDAHNFVRALKLIQTGADTVSTLQTEYFDKATAGLKQMLIKYPFSAGSLARAMTKYPEKYDRIEHNVALIETRIPQYRQAYARYQEFVPEIIFPPTFFLVDRNRGIGSGSPDGQLISIERRTDESIGRLENLLVHELTHFQQLHAAGSDEFYAVFNAKKSLLALAIREGTAQFMARRITDGKSKAEARAFILADEKAVWQDFQTQMMSADTSNWMWSTPENPDQPRDVGYEMGALIVEAYYKNADNKKEALAEMFAVKDFARFLADSGYDGNHVSGQ